MPLRTTHFGGPDDDDDASLAANGENGGSLQESRRMKKVHEEFDDKDHVAALVGLSQNKQHCCWNRLSS